MIRRFFLTIVFLSVLLGGLTSAVSAAPGNPPLQSAQRNEVSSCHYGYNWWTGNGQITVDGWANCTYANTRTYRLKICRDIALSGDECTSSSYVQASRYYEIVLSYFFNCGVGAVRNYYEVQYLTDNTGHSSSVRHTLVNC